VSGTFFEDTRGRGAMRVSRASIVAFGIVVGLALSACTDASPPESRAAKAASVEAIAGSAVARVTLSPAAARRLDVQTEPITESKARRGRDRELVVPYAAVLYDPEGDTWVYTTSEALSYVRAPIVVDRIVGNDAFASSGPAVGTEVVTVGAAELLGVEYEVGEE
jgi:hypothetical protein